MIVDQFGGEHSSCSHGAVEAFCLSVRAVAAHRVAGDHMASALRHDRDLPAAHALTGLGTVLSGKAENVSDAAAALRRARLALERASGGTPFEIALTDALGLAIAGQIKKSAACLEAHCEIRPRAFLAIKLANSLRFMSGQPEVMLRTTNAVLPNWDASVPGFGYLLGMHAFGLEECGAFEEAENAGRRAVRHEPDDTWGIHAVGHVMEMQGRAGDGMNWLEASRPLWPSCNNFAYHLAWHLALFHLESRDYGRVLELYDDEVRPSQTDDFRDMANAVSLLWRLDQEGVDVGRRWDGLYEIAMRRREDTTLVFASLHYLLALVAAGDFAAAEDLVSAMRTSARLGNDDQSRVARSVGVNVADAILGLSSGKATENRTFDELAIELPAIGGSHAQRDVFLRTMMTMAAAAGDAGTLAGLKRIRESLRSEDRFGRLVSARLGHRGRRSEIVDAMPHLDVR